MAVIKPTFTLTANTTSATTNPGPLSVALSLSATDLLTVGSVESQIVTVAYSANSDNATLLIDGSAQAAAFVSGTNGSFIFMKNTSAASTTNFIQIGMHPVGIALDDLNVAGEDQRFFTLKVGEFAFFPYDYTQDIVIDANAASQTLEYWMFHRA